MCEAARAPFAPGAVDLTQGDPRFEAALEAARDLQILEFALDTLAPFGTDSPERGLLIRSLKDSVLPQSQGESPGRDSQFELFVAAVCVAAGLGPVRIDEPDILCVVNGKPFCIAAKRVKNFQQVQKRIREGARQVGRRCIPGVVALDSTLAVTRPDFRVHRVLQDRDFHRRYEMLAGEVTTVMKREVPRWLKGSIALGVVTHDFVVRQQMPSMWSCEIVTDLIPNHRDRPKRLALWQPFATSYPIGLPTVKRAF